MELLFHRRKFFDVADVSVTNDHVGRALGQRLHEIGDCTCVVLVVRVGIDDEVRAEFETGVQPSLERRCQSAVLRELHHVIDAMGTRDLNGRIGRSVIDDQPFHHVYSWHAARQGAERHGKLILLIETRNLDYEFLQLTHSVFIGAKAREFSRSTPGVTTDISPT